MANKTKNTLGALKEIETFSLQREDQVCMHNVCRMMGGESLWLLKRQCSWVKKENYHITLEGIKILVFQSWCLIQQTEFLFFLLCAKHQVFGGETPPCLGEALGEGGNYDQYGGRIDEVLWENPCHLN